MWLSNSSAAFLVPVRLFLSSPKLNGNSPKMLFLLAQRSMKLLSTLTILVTFERETWRHTPPSIDISTFCDVIHPSSTPPGEVFLSAETKKKRKEKKRTISLYLPWLSYIYNVTGFFFWIVKMTSGWGDFSNNEKGHWKARGSFYARLKAPFSPSTSFAQLWRFWYWTGACCFYRKGLRSTWQGRYDWPWGKAPSE